MRTASTNLALATVLAALLSCNQRGDLQHEVVKLELTWVGWGCRCPDWCNDVNAEDPEECIFVEPADPSLELPAVIWSEHPMVPRVRFTGRFYEGEGRPNGYYSEAVTEGRVLQYVAYEVIH